MINKLYDGFATYYAEITNDRDFKGQLEWILSRFARTNCCKIYLELFAGHAVHSLEALKKGIDVWAIDSSSEMKSLALTRGLPNANQYIVGNLPLALAKIPDGTKFDCVTSLYHGISNLNLNEVFQLLKKLKDYLNPSGKIFLEIHDIYYVMEYVSNPIIKRSVQKSKNGEIINYAWPSYKINWDHFSFKAEVPVTIDVENEDGIHSEEFISYDRIYSTEEILFLADLLSYSHKVHVNQVEFYISVIIELYIK